MQTAGRLPCTVLYVGNRSLVSEAIDGAYVRAAASCTYVCNLVRTYVLPLGFALLFCYVPSAICTYTTISIFPCSII